MSAETLDAWVRTLWQAHLGLSLGLVAVALLRRPLRRLAGPQESYALWLLPLLGLAAGLLPDAGIPRITLEAVEWRGAWQALPAVAAVPVGLPQTVTGALVAWGLGCLVIIGLQALRHWRFVRRLPADAGLCLRTPRGSSPGLLGIWRPRLLLPMDFEERFSPQERQWVLAHEAQHARRHDNAVRLLAAVLQALAWFNPLLWWALPALRHDQELACDAALLGQQPGQWQGYARALLKTDPQFAVPIAASAWQPTHPLKERIDMLKNIHGLTPWRRRAGRLALCTAAVLAVGTVQALQSEQAASVARQTPTAATKPAASAATGKRPVKAAAVCQTMVRPEVPIVNLTGSFEFKATYEIGPGGKPVNIRVTDGEAAFQDAIRKAISQYVCNARGKEMEVEQMFIFNID